MFPIHHSPFHACFVLHMSTHVCMHHYIESQVVVIAPFVVIAVLEDLKADSTLMQRAEAVHLGCTPSEPCIFRGDREWRAIFELLRLRVVERMTPDRRCARNIPRALYVLQHDRRLDGRITIVGEGRNSMERM